LAGCGSSWADSKPAHAIQPSAVIMRFTRAGYAVAWRESSPRSRE
jgi:hypothetical protein